ncbi:hypothetical protein LTR22_025674 [Elasticomyces elasticus]|nr:hypothetical protein LTR22_025674 [Elasticomyces elasticus]
MTVLKILTAPTLLGTLHSYKKWQMYVWCYTHPRSSQLTPATYGSKMGIEQVASLSTLPVELLGLVVSFLDFIDVARFQQACTHIRAVCTRPFSERLTSGTRHAISVDHGRRCGEPDYGDLLVYRHTLGLHHQQHPQGRGGEVDSQICVQPTLIALIHSITHSDSLCEQLTSLTISGVEMLPRRPGARLRNAVDFEGLYFPQLTRLSVSETAVSSVEDLAMLVEAHARTLQDLILKTVNFHERASVVLDWLALLIYIRDDLVHLEHFDTAIWQKELFDLTRMLDYRCVCYDKDGKPLRGLLVQRQSQLNIATNGYIISEVRLEADGRIAVTKGITAHVARMRRRTRIDRMKKAIGSVLQRARKTTRP